MSKYDESDGVWRTVGGRRIFIRDGQSLSDAMKSSGKFKSAKKRTDYKTKIEEIKATRKANEELDRDLKWAKEQYEQDRDKDAYKRRVNTIENKRKENDDYKQSLKGNDGKQLKEKYMNIPQEERVKAYEEGKNWKDLVKEKENNKVKSLSGKNETDNKGREVSQKEYDEFRQAYREGKISKEDYRNDNYDALKEKKSNNFSKMSDQELKDELDHNRSMLNEMDRRLSGRYELSDEQREKLESRAAHYESTKDDIRDELRRRKGMEPVNRENEMTASQAKAKYGTDNEEIINAGKEKSERVSVVKESSIKSQQSDIESASGLKVKRAFETDNFGNGKEDRFQLEDGRYISHSKESLGAKDDTWSINKVENGSIKSQDFKSYDDMIKHLSSSNKFETITKNDKKYNVVEHKEGGSYEGIGANRRKFVAESPERYRIENPKDKSDWGWIDKKEYNQLKSQKDSSSEIKEIAEIRKRETPGQVINNITRENRAYRNAYNDYKKKHPNSKLSFAQFVNISEGK